MEKVNTIFILALMIVGTSGFAFALEGTQQFCDVRSSEFLREAISWIKNSNMTQEEKNIHYQRIRTWMTQRVEKMDFVRFILSVLLRTNDSNLSPEKKAEIYNRVRLLVQEHC